MLFVGDSVGINDVRISSMTGAILATAWHRIRTSTTSDLVSPDNQVYRSLDGGDTWELLPSPWGEGERCRIGIDESQGRFVINPVGADLQFSNLYRSGDDGASWLPMVPEGAMPEGVLGGFGWYFSKVRMNPWDFNDISVLGVELWNTLDGGGTWERMGPEWWTYEVHADKHDLQWVGPDEVILATDGGVSKHRPRGDVAGHRGAAHWPILPRHPHPVGAGLVHGRRTGQRHDDWQRFCRGQLDTGPRRRWVHGALPS